jgi:autotransporter-associated beta strand protein
MAFFSWSRWLRSLVHSKTKPIQRHRTSLRLEALESRLAPASFVWTGAAGGGLWSTAGNWQGGVAPAASDPGPDDLTFQSGSAITILNNNIVGLKINSITFSSQYSISGQPITLGATSGATNSLTGQIIVNGLGITDTLGFSQMTLAGAGSGSAQQTFKVSPQNTLDVTSQLLGTGGAGLTQTLGGTVIFDADNSGFSGPITVAAGVAQVTNSFSLGTFTGFSDGTTVLNGAQLQVSKKATNLVIPEAVRLNGAGIANRGALYNAAGNNNIWSGPVELDSDVTVGGVVNTSLNITGVISDLGSGHNVIKEGQGTIGFSGTNTYRGTTTINDGILQVGNSQGLGTGPGGIADDSTADDITVNSSATKTGTLQINGPASGPGLTIVNKLLILNGGGFNGLGALDNLQGNNTWTGNVILGSPAPIGSAVTIRTENNPVTSQLPPYYTLTISGVVEDPLLAATSLTKTGLGTLDFTNSNTYTGKTTIVEGILEVQDSQALGQLGKQGQVFVEFNSQNGHAGTLELAVDNIVDSITKTRNTLIVSNPLWIWGPGENNVGALYSASGTNTYAGNVTVNDGPPENDSFLPNNTAGSWSAPLASIGVAADPNPTSTRNYLQNDFSLTVTGSVIGGWKFAVGDLTKPLMQKFGAGDLILPSANNKYTSSWEIVQGWVTAENSNSFGAITANITQQDEPTITIDSGAAVHLYDPATASGLSGTGINIHQNFQIYGPGINSASTTFSQLNQQGAIENIGGLNTITGNILLHGNAALGVEQTFGTSQLSLLGTQSQDASSVYEQVFSGRTEAGLPTPPTSGSTGAEDVNIIQTGSTSGSITVNYMMFFPPPFFDGVPDRLDVYYGIYGEGGQLIGGTGGFVFNPLFNVVTIPLSYAPIGNFSSTYISIVMDRGGDPSGPSAWTYQVQAVPNPATAPAGIVKTGSGLLDIQGDGSYQGGVDVQSGVLLVQNNTALGAPETGANDTVEAGASIAFANGTAYNNGGVESGTQIWGQHLIVNTNTNAQTITITGAQTGTFQLQFISSLHTSITSTLPDNITLGALSLALNGLPSIQDVGGVTVTQLGNEFTVAFKQTEPLITAQNVTTGGTVYVSLAMGTNTLGAPLGAITVLTSTMSPWVTTVPILKASTFLSGLPGTTVLGTAQNSATIMPADVEWRGPITLAGTTTVDVGQGARFIIDGAIDDAFNPLTTGSDLILVDTGEVTVNDAGTYRGNTYLGTSNTLGTIGYDPYGVNEFFNGGASLPNPGGTAQGTVITVGNSEGLGAAGSNVYIQGGSSVQLEGAVSVSGKTLYLNGSGLGTAGNPATASWFQQGAAPLLNGQTNGNTAVSGRMTGIAVAPNDPDTIYVSAAGGGAWKTVNGGKTWVQIFDNANTANVNVPLFTGAIAVDPHNPNIVVVGTGEANNSGDSFYGTGVYRSTDGGHSWTQLLDANPLDTANPANFEAISRVLIDPLNGNFIYVAINDFNGGVANQKVIGAGVWRYDVAKGTWFDLTSWVSVFRQTPPTTGNFPKTGPGTPGPDDDFRLSFPQGKATSFSSSACDYSDLGFSTATGVLYMSLGTPGLGEAPYNETTNSPTVDVDPAKMNAVYRCINPETATSTNFLGPTGRPVWYVGDGNNMGVNGFYIPGVGGYNAGGSKEYPTDDGNDAVNVGWPFGKANSQQVRQGMIKFTVAADGMTIYAINPFAFNEDLPTLSGSPLRDIYVSTDGGQTWNPTATQPANPLATQGWYDVTITTLDGRNVFVGGATTNPIPGLQSSFVYWSPNGGTTWKDISKDTSGNGPHTDQHASAVDAMGNMYMGGDGGIYQFSPSSQLWTDLNNNLATQTVNGVAVNPIDPNNYFAGAQDNGAQIFTGSESWSLVNQGDGGLVRIDPANPLNVYEVQNGFLTKSTTGGTNNSFNPILGVGGLYFPFAIDQIESNRILVGGGGLLESDDQGGTFNFIGPTVLGAPVPIAALAMSTYQGVFEPDKQFPLVADKGANNYDPDTIYVTDGAIGGSTVFFTKDHGTSWHTLPNNLPAITVSAIAVDPRNRDNVYVTAGDDLGAGLGRVFQLHYVAAAAKGAQFQWQEIGMSEGLPDVPTRSVVVDPHTGNVYVGTDVGVYELPANGSKWIQFGTGLPLASVTDMTIDPNTNMLTVATYGRSVYQVLLNNTAAGAGALTSLTGVGQWNGPIVLTGPTTFSAGGTQVGQINNFAATLNIQGAISDLVDGTTTNNITVGTAANIATVIFSGPNSYTDPTEVAAGVLIADNITALGSTTKTTNTTVDLGTALKLETSVNSGGTLVLNGDGPQPAYNGHNTGALESISNGVTYTGPIKLNTAQVTIGVDSGSTLTLLGAISDAGNNANLIKELTGTLILAQSSTGPDIYGGQTFVFQGALQIASAFALPANSNTTVLDGAQLQLSGSVAVPSSITVDLAGTGINATGALLNISGNNIFDGTLVLDAVPGFSATTYPVGTVSFGAGRDGDAFDPNNILNILGPIKEAVPGAGQTLFSGLTKVGPDTVVLGGSNTNTYHGTTFIQNGYVVLQSTQELGDNSSNFVNPFANDPIQRLTGVDPAQVGSFTVGLKIGNLLSTSGNISSTGTAFGVASATQLQLRNVVLPRFVAAGLLPAGVSATVMPAQFTILGTTITEWVLTVVFTGIPAGFVMPQMIALATNGATVIESDVADNGYGTEVQSGVLSQFSGTPSVGALQLDLQNSPNGNTVNGETLLLSGVGPTGNGALENVSGTNTWTAGVTLNTNTSTVLADQAGQHLVDHDSIGVDVFGGVPTRLSLNGNLGGAFSAELDKVGPGTLVLSHADTYAGTTDVQVGFLRANNNLALGGPITDSVQTLTVSGALTGTFTLTYTDASGNAITSTSPAGGIPVDYTNPATLIALQQAMDSMVGPGNSIVSQQTLSQTITKAAEVGNTVTITTSAALTVAVGQQVIISGVGTAAYNGTFVVTKVGPGNTFQYTDSTSGLATDTNGGTATVNGATYTVTFIGTLAGQIQNQLAVNSITSGSQVDIATVTDGGRGNTIVETGATLQVANGRHISTEQVILNGQGVGGVGALEGLIGNESWDPNTVLVAPNPVAPDSSIILASDTYIGADTTATFTINQQIITAAGVGATNLTKVGSGTLVFANSLLPGLGTSNSYNGLTTVANGTLDLAKPTGFIAIPHDLTVGDGVGAPLSAIARLENPGQQFSTTAIVIVNSDGLLDGNGQTETVGNLTINDGTVQAGVPAGGVMTINALTMTGGTVSTNSAGTVTLGGDVTATSDANQEATITGTGTFNVGSNRTFNVSLGGQPADLDITLPIKDTLTFTKAGTGRLELDADSSATAGAPTVTGGELQVDGKINNVILAGGTVSGGTQSVAGQIGVVTGTGTINPGDNGALNPDGFLQTTPGGLEAWTNNITFEPDMIDAKNNHGASLVAGTDYDQLIVNGGTLNLGGAGNATTGAALAGLVGVNVAINDSFTIIQAINGGTIQGRFIEPVGEEASGAGIAYIGGAKFDVDYSDPTKVVLTRVKENTTLTISSPLGTPIANSVYGQDATFTATMVAEAGAGGVPVTDTVTFTVDATAGNPSGIAFETVNLNALDQATFDPQAINVGNFTVPVGPHTVTVTFNGDPNFYTPPPASMQWIVGKDNSAINLSPPSTTAVFGQTVQITATVTATAPGGQTPLYQIPSSSGNPLNVTFTIDPGATQQIVKQSLDITGSTVLSLSNLAFGTHHIVASYSGDGNYFGSNTASSVLVVVNKDNSSVTLLATPPSPGTVGQPVTFTARVTTNAPGTATPLPNDFVTFFDGTTQLGQGFVNFNSVSGFYEATFTTGANTLIVGTHTIKATYAGDSLINGSSATPISYVVNQIVTTTTLTSSANPAALNQVLVFTSTVSSATTAGTLTGSVAFYDFYNQPGQKLLGVGNLNTNDIAQFSLTTLGIGTHQITAVYSSSTNYATSQSAPLAQVVLYSSTTSLSVNPSPAIYGQNVALTSVVVPGPGMPPVAGTPTGTVAFYVDGAATPIGTAPLDPTGTALLNTTALTVGTHTILAIYTPAGGSSFQTSTSSVLTVIVESVTTTTLTSSANPAGLNQPVTLTATIAATSPGASTSFGGTVTFSDFFNGVTTPLASNVSVDPATGIATYTTTSLALGTHAISASYSGSLANYDAPSSTVAPLGEIIRYAASITTLISSQNPSPQGNNVTFTATITPVVGTPPAAGNPTGTITFMDGTTPLGTSPIVGVTASFTTTTPLAVGTHPITAVYSGNTNFAPTTSNSLSQNVLFTTATSLITSISPSTFGQSVTFTATVTSTGGIPVGTVSFFDGGSTLLKAAVALDPNGVAIFTTSSLSAASHSISAVFATNNITNGFFTSTGTATQVVNAANTITTVTTSKSPTVFGENVTFTATVNTLSPGSGIPVGGTVTFFDNTGSGPVQIGSGAISANGPVGQATFSTSSLSVTTHNISATFVAASSPNFKTSTGSTNQVVNASPTSTTLASSANASVSGQTVTFTATVTAAGNGAGIPTGTVDFFDDTGSGPAKIGSGNLNGSGQATFATSGLTVGPHSVTAVYNTTTNFTTSTSTPALNQVVNQDATTTTLASSVNPSVFTQLITFTATITSNSPGSGIPTGTVNFYADGNVNPIGTGGVDVTGHATMQTSALPFGSHSVTAIYQGDTNFKTSTSAVLTQQVNVDGTNTTLTSTGSPSFFSQPVTFTAKVTASNPGGGPASGTVNFLDTSTNAILATNVSLNASGIATFTTSTLPVGLHNVVASFNANSSFTSSTSPVATQVVTADNTNTALTSTPNPSVFGQSVTITATVTAANPGTGFASGLVTFTDMTTGLTLATGVPLNGAGQASFTTTTLTGGTHSIVASYGATTSFNASSSAPLTQTVNASNSKTVLTSTTNPTVFGQAATFTAIVSATGGGSGTPSGTVTFFDGTNPLGTGSLDNTGKAVFTTPSSAPLTVGPHSITAVYGATANFNTSTSNAVTQQVNAANTITTVGSSQNASVYSQSVTFTATVFAANPGTGIPTGSVNFFDGTTPIGSGNLNSSGVATMSTTTLNVGGHPITAVYAATTNYGTSISSSLNQVVNQDGTSVALTVAPSQSVFTQNVTFTATVSAAPPGGNGPGSTPTGIVTFLDGGNSIGTGTLNGSGVATLTINNLPVGTHASITASYGATGNFFGSTSPAVSEVVKQDGTTTTISVSSSTSVYSQPVTFTATVLAQGSGVPASGIVKFTDTSTGATLAAAVALSPSGTATLTTNTLSVGNHNVTATFIASPNFTSSVSGPANEVVSTATTTTTVTSSSTQTGPTSYTSVYSEPVTLTAVVSAAPGTGIPAGTVSFKRGGTSFGSAPVAFVAANNDYEASFTTTTLPVGTDSITASYTPTNSTNFKASTSAAISQIVSPDTVSVTLTSAVNPSVVNTAVSLTAVVTPDAPGAGIPTGSVTFVDTTTGKTLNGGVPVTLAGGKATLSATLTAPIGTHTIKATYNPANANFITNNTTLAQGVFYASKTTITLSPTSSFEGDIVTLNAKVAAGTGAPAGSQPPTSGSVTFFDGTTILGTVGFTSPGVATLTSDAFGGFLRGTHKITAQFSGDGITYAQSTSAAATETVYARPVSWAIDLSRSTVPTTTTTPFKVTVQMFDGNGALITGSPLQATISEQSGSQGGFVTKTVGFSGGTTDAFVFSNLFVTRGGGYTLQIQIANFPDLPTLTYSFSGVAGRLT